MSGTSTLRRGPSAAQVIIFLTGFSFLLYEVSWHRLLSLVLGTTVTAATIVLASFMAGFGVGARVLGRAADNRPAVGRLLGLLLLGIGLVSALDYVLITRFIPWLYGWLGDAGLAAGTIEWLVFVVAGLLLFAPAFLMGGVFPLISKVVVGAGGSIAAALGRLYALETLGSTVGGLLTGFVLLGALGQRNTTFLAVAVNFILGLWVLTTRLFAQAATPIPTDTTPKTGRKGGRDSTDPAVLRTAALVGAFICGFSILGLQVLWLRMFRIYLTNTSYTFALISSLVILGLFAGSYFFARRGHLVVDRLAAMSRVVLLLAAMTSMGLLLLVNLPEVLMFPFQSLLASPLARVLLLPFVAALLIVFPPAVCSGYAFPLACSMYASNRGTIAGDVGRVLLINTTGAVIGPVVAAFVLLPWLGAALSVVMVLVLLIGAALWILHRRRLTGAAAFAKPAFFAVLVVLSAVVVIRPEIRILPPSFASFDREVLFYRESVEGTLSVGKDRGTRTESKYTFVNNSAVIGSTYDAVKVVKMVGHFPFFAGLDGGDVLVIGFGIGVTTSAIASHPEVESITCVELVTGLKDAAVYYRDLNHDIVNDPRLEILSGDGRHHLQLTSERYDLISCDPTHPILGSGNLYTRDYFALCRERLKPGGMVSQYLPLHKLRIDELMGIIATFRDVFPDCSVWLGHYHAVLLGSTEPMTIDFTDWSSRVEAIGRDAHFYVDPHHLAATLVLDGAKIAELLPQPRFNTDDHSYTEFFAPACLDPDNIAHNLRYLMENRCSINGVFHNIDDPERMSRFLSGNQLLGESLYRKFMGDRAGGLRALQEACRVNPEDQEYPFLIRLDY